MWADNHNKKPPIDINSPRQKTSIFGLGVKKEEGASSLDTTVRRAGEIEKAKAKKRGSIKEVPFVPPAEYRPPPPLTTSLTAAGSGGSGISIVVTGDDESADGDEMSPLRPHVQAHGPPKTHSPPSQPPESHPQPQPQPHPNSHHRHQHQHHHSRPTVLHLPATMALGKHTFELGQVFICRYTDSIGILRFAVSAKEVVGVQTTLDIINSLMRLQDPKGERPNIVKDGAKVLAFHPNVFIEGLLTDNFGAKGVCWDADKETDRLFVYSMGVVTDCESPELVKKVVYKISQMEDDARAVVSEDYLSEFNASDNVYKRFATSDGGIWSTFHVDGGSTLIFAEPKEAPDIPIYHDERLLGLRKRRIIHGSSRPLVGFSLTDILIFKRMFLRRINQELDQLIVTSSSSRKTLMLIRGIHLRGLRFRAKFTAAKVSTTRAGKEQYVQWDEVMGMETLQGRLQETLTQLNEYYSGIEDKANQKHIDFLTVILGCLGATSLVLDLTTFYTNTDRSEGVAYYVPATALGIFTLIAIAFIYWIRS